MEKSVRVLSLARLPPGLSSAVSSGARFRLKLLPPVPR